MSPLQRDVKAALMEASRPLFEELALKPGDEFPLTSRSRRWHKYTMTVTPEGYVVHQGEGCEGEHFNGPSGCWHSVQSQGQVSRRGDVAAFWPRTEEEARFWAHVEKGPACWLWTGAHDKYGHFGRGSLRDGTRRTENAHLTAFAFAYAECPAEVCHECDTPLCCRPTHLFAGTHASNMADAAAKGRLGNKLSWPQVLSMRERYAAGESQKALAREFGVNAPTVSKVVHGKTWQESEPHVTQALTPYQPSQAPVRLDFNEEQLKTITDVICVDGDGHKAPAAFVQLYLAACRRSGLDPFLRQIYALNIRGKWTMYVGIDGYRVISERTGLDEGMDGPQFSDDGKTWHDYPFVDQPAYCRVGIWRKGVPRAFIAVCTMKSKINGASDSWKKDPAGMLAKCTEALARRRAFPADMAVIPQEAVFDDADGAPITGADVPDGQWREIAAQPSTPEQRREVGGYWSRAGDAKRHSARERWPSVFPKPGPGVMNQLARLTQQDADDVLAFFQDVTPVEESTATEQNSPPSSPPANVGEGLADPDDPPWDAPEAAEGQDGASTQQPATKRTPAALLTAIGKKHGNGRALAARAIMPMHFGTMDPSKLTAEAAADYAALLEVWLNDPDHEHEAKYTADGRAVCGRCGIEVKEPEPAAT